MRHKGVLIPATALNISCGGMCLATDNPEVSDDGDVEVIFDLSSTEVDVSIRGKIVRMDEGSTKKIGVQFTNLYSVGYKAIEKFCQKNRN